MSPFRMQFSMALATAVFFIFTLVINQWLFSYSEFARGIHLIYLPAGVRLLSTLLFGGAGAFGLLIASWLVSFFYFFPDDFMRALAGGIIATVAPYGVYLVAQRVYGLRSSLANLTSGRLLICIIACSLASPLLHHIWFAIYEPPRPLFKSFLMMAVGDLNGTLLVVYAARTLLALLPRFAR